MNELAKGNMTSINLSSRMGHAHGTTILECQEKHQDIALICSNGGDEGKGKPADIGELRQLVFHCSRINPNPEDCL